MQTTLREYQPINNGFYRISLTDSTKTGDGWTVSIFWMTKTDVQYPVNILEGVDDSSKPFVPCGSHRAKLVLQNKAVVPFFNSVCPQGLWEITDKFQKETAYVLTHTDGVPCEFSSCLSQISEATDDWIKSWKSWQIGTREELGSKLRKSLT